MMFGPVVCSVGGTGAPKKTELVLGLAVSQPEKSHVHGFGLSWLYVVVHDSEGCGIVGLHGSLGLCVMAHFCKCYSLGDDRTCVDVECTRFCFCCGGHDSLDELCEVENIPVVCRVITAG
jgi:hypothetical protein